MKAKLNDFSIPEMVKMMREWTGNTQESFAQNVGYSVSQIRNIEQGRSNVYLHVFLSWCKENGIDVYMEKSTGK